MIEATLHQRLLKKAMVCNHEHHIAIWYINFIDTLNTQNFPLLHWILYTSVHAQNRILRVNYSCLLHICLFVISNQQLGHLANGVLWLYIKSLKLLWSKEGFWLWNKIQERTWPRWLNRERERERERDLAFQFTPQNLKTWNAAVWVNIWGGKLAFLGAKSQNPVWPLWSTDPRWNTPMHRLKIW